MKVLVLFVVALVATRAALADDDDHSDYYAVLTGAKQTTPIKTAASASIFFDVDDDEDKVDWFITIDDIKNLTMGHIHLGGPKVNGPVVVGLIPVGASVSAFSNGNLPMLPEPASGDLHYLGTFTPEDFVGNWSGKPLSTLISAFNSNNAYVNLHTTAYPAGIIRGQVTPSDHD